MLGDQYYFRQLMSQLEVLRWRFARGGASRRVAEAICKDWEEVAIRQPMRPRRAA